MNNPEIGAKATRQLTVTKNQLASSGEAVLLMYSLLLW